MILKNLHLLTKLEIWYPKYSSAHTETADRVALLACYKVDNASPVILVEFTKAAHLKGQRFCINKKEAQSYPIDSNGKIKCHAVPLSAFEPWETREEFQNTAINLFED